MPGKNVLLQYYIFSTAKNMSKKEERKKKMRKNKKIQLIMLTSAVAIATCGCSFGNKTPTAEELLKNPFGDDMKNISATYSISFDGGISMDAFLGGIEDTSENTSEEKTTSQEKDTGKDKKEDTRENAEDTDSSSEEMMNVGLNLEGTCYYSSSLVYVEGKIGYSLFGISGDTPYKSYAQTDKDGSVVYSYNEDDDEWTKEDGNNVPGDITKNLTSDIFDSLSEVQVNKKADKAYYTLSGTITGEKISNIAKEETASENTEDGSGSSVSDMASAAISSDDLKNTKVDVDLSYDKDKVLRSVCISYDKDNKTSSVKVDSFGIKITIDKVNGNEITIPDDVIKSAVSEDTTERDSTETPKEDATEAVDETKKDSKKNKGTSTEDVTVTDSNKTSDIDISEKNSKNTEGQTEVQTEAASEEDVYEVTDSNESNLATLVFGTSTVTETDITQVIASAGLNAADESVVSAMVNLLNSYTVSKLTANLSSYSMWNDANKEAIIYFYGLGVFSLDDLVSYGISAEEITNGYSEIIPQQQ